MKQQSYVAPPKFYDANHRDSQRVYAIPGTITSDQDQHDPAVAVLVDNAPRLVITAEAALRLAHQIADAVEVVKK